MHRGRGHRAGVAPERSITRSACLGAARFSSRRRPEAGAVRGLVDASDVSAPLPHAGHELIGAIDRARRLGRGGAGVPGGGKWRAVAERSKGDAVVLVNGAEGEPHSKKDRLLMT